MIYPIYTRDWQDIVLFRISSNALTISNDIGEASVIFNGNVYIFLQNTADE